MDIHKPHAPHSLGEFAREIATIVTGILIALALEQGVTWLHERHVAADALASIRAEVAHDVGVEQAVRGRIPCTIGRLAEVGRILDDPDSRLDPARLPIWIGPIPIGDMLRTRYEAASSAGRLALLAPDDQRLISDFYADFAEFDSAERQQRRVRATALADDDARCHTRRGPRSAARCAAGGKAGGVRHVGRFARVRRKGATLGAASGRSADGQAREPCLQGLHPAQDFARGRGRTNRISLRTAGLIALLPT